MKEYIKKIRSKLGNEKFIHPAARIIIENKNQEILVIERVDNGRIGIPAGALEENETIEECIIREVREETGLKLIELEVIGISSNPDTETVEYMNGDKIQYFTVEFYSNKWEGSIKIGDKNEVRKAKFMDIAIIKHLPKNECSAFESLAYYRKHKKIMLK
ncbi:MAG: NUDIX domain-containing protein [Saprospiraceae bacterium]|nr:NUDIX domain-containing protein [Saprospiraceae bacterium]